MNDEQASVSLLAEIAATKLLLAKLYQIVYVVGRFPPEHIAALHKAIRDGLGTQTLVRSNDPIISDVYSDEVATKIDHFLRGLETPPMADAKAPPEQS
jgi:hypothetical protein